MYIRKEIRELSDSEKKELIEAILVLKTQGVYDTFVETHLDAMSKLTPMVEPPPDPGSRTRNSAHRGPTFLPWHRIFIYNFENELKNVNPNINLPYWDWTIDAINPGDSPMWSNKLFGASGNSQDSYRITQGPFAYNNGWELKVDTANGGNALRRRLGAVDWYDPANGRRGTMNIALPTLTEVDLSLQDPLYDVYPWDSALATSGFRNRLEGWTQTGMPIRGPQLHNKVHVYIGGGWLEVGQNGQPENVSGTMQLGSSPNDPIFFLHHAYVDKLWEEWSKQHVGPNQYLPQSGGPIGHNLNDSMYPFPEKPSSCLRTSDLGYSYSNFQVSNFYSDEKEFLATFDQGDVPPVGIVKSHFLPGNQHHHDH